MPLKLLLAAAVLVALTGCQSVGGHSPYEYRYADAEGRELCLIVDAHPLDGVTLTLIRLLEERGFVVREVSCNEDDCRQYLKFSYELGGWSGQRISSAKMENFRRVHGVKYTAETQDGAPEATFGSPAQDDALMLRMMLDRIFPQPVPWNG